MRGLLIPPGGAPNAVEVHVLTSEDYRDRALSSGAKLITNEMLDALRKENKISFSKFVCTTEKLASIRDLARVLGPKGMFPNAKTGTLVSPTDLENTIKIIKSG